MNINKRPDFTLLELEKLKKRKRRELSELEKQEIEEAFKLFDTDADEKINYHELKVSLRALGFEVKKQEVQKLMSDYDVEGTGFVTFTDFFEIAKNMVIERDPQEELKKAFKLFDEDSTGKISFRNLRRVAK
jgi:centrin-3